MRLRLLLHAGTAVLWLAMTLPAAVAENVTLTNCLVTLIEEAQVPAQESGVLMSVCVKEGVSVKREQMLAQIDDSQASVQRKAICAEEQAARDKSSSDIDIRFAKAAAAAAKMEYEKATIANARTNGAISEVEVERLKLTWIKTKLQIEQAHIEHRVNTLITEQKGAELAAADNNILRRKIVSPMDGMVVQVNHHVGEWVRPGDPVLKLIRVDRLRVEGHLNANMYPSDELAGRAVEVQVAGAGKKPLTFSGRVVFVSPVVEAGGEFKVWAEVDNRLGTQSNWLLRPGSCATMTIEWP